MSLTLMDFCNTTRAAATSDSICFPSGPAEAESTEILLSDKLARNLALYTSKITVYGEEQQVFITTQPSAFVPAS